MLVKIENYNEWMPYVVNEGWDLIRFFHHKLPDNYTIQAFNKMHTDVLEDFKGVWYGIKVRTTEFPEVYDSMILKNEIEIPKAFLDKYKNLHTFVVGINDFIQNHTYVSEFSTKELKSYQASEEMLNIMESNKFPIRQNDLVNFKSAHNSIVAVEDLFEDFRNDLSPSNLLEWHNHYIELFDLYLDDYVERLYKNIIKMIKQEDLDFSTLSKEQYDKFFDNYIFDFLQKLKGYYVDTDKLKILKK